ncbi:membrane protein insertase YidC [Vulgatibacter sp.]|uniref:membrane protein insertase YidC n=1 Tax=Vulgatibacter sp. TaxID=1971226 RepID=UPI003563D967
MDSNKRLILTVILSVGIILGFQWLYPQIAGVPEQPPATAGEKPTEAAAPTPPDAAVAPGAAAAAPVPADVPEQRASLRTDELVLGFSSRGAALVQAELQGTKGKRQGGAEAPQVDLAAGLEAGDPKLFEVALAGGLGSVGACEQLETGGQSVRYRCSGEKVQLEKTFTVTGDQTLGLEVVVRNTGGAPVEGSLELLVPARVEPARQESPGCGGMLSAPPQPTQVICRHGDDVTRRMFDEDEKIFTGEGPASFAGIEERYFVAVAAPTKAPAPSTCRLETPTNLLYVTRLITPVGSVPVGGSASVQYALVLGQKDLDVLATVSEQVAAQSGQASPMLDETVDLGFWAAIARMLFALLRVFHTVIPNWGVAIILLTVFVKVLTFPLAWKSMKAMESMRALAPEIEKLKAKHGTDREKLNLEMMKLYQQHKVNPLGGCLPMLIQMPIWLALYTVLQTSVVLYNEPFIGGWINDLTSKDPYYILPLAMGVTMFITQKMQPMQMEPAQQKMMLYFMPIFFTFIMLNLPAGLTLYIFTNNLLSIAQQLALRKSMGMPMVGPMPAAAATVTVEPERKGKKSKK